jgi:hypothetical protein
VDETRLELFVYAVAQMSSRTGDQQTAVEAFELRCLFCFACSTDLLLHCSVFGLPKTERGGLCNRNHQISKKLPLVKYSQAFAPVGVSRFITFGDRRSRFVTRNWGPFWGPSPIPDKGYRGKDARDKKLTMDTYWVSGVNNLGKFGRWAFAEFADVYQIGSDFHTAIESNFNKMIDMHTALLTA